MKTEVDKTKTRIKPMPNTIVSCRKDGKDNALAVGVASMASIDPIMVMVGIIPTRYSYDMVKETGEFIVNIPSKDFAEKYMYLGTVSGRDEDKLADINTKDGHVVDAPILTDCPVNIECKVVDSITPGSHELFIGEVVKVHCDEEYVDEEQDIKWDEIELI